MGWSKPLDEKESFLRREILSSTINGAFQHAGVYEEKPDRLRKSEWEEQKKDFRKKIGKYLDEVVEEYNPDKNHYERIRMFVKTIKDPLLKKDKNNEVSFGVAQKLVNLYLKYLWCLAKFNDIPPHCPIDAGILKKKNGDAEELTRRNIEEPLRK